MEKSFDFQAVACKVFSLLTDIPDTRDDDRLLLMEIWNRETKSNNISDFFDEFLNGKISHPESIRRMRQKIQERHPSLRGQKWEARHNMEGAICEQLNFFDKW